MQINTDEIKNLLLDDALSNGYIALKSGVAKAAIGRFRAGLENKNAIAKSEFLNMRLETAIKLQKLCNERKNKI